MKTTISLHHNNVFESKGTSITFGTCKQLKFECFNVKTFFWQNVIPFYLLDLFHGKFYALIMKIMNFIFQQASNQQEQKPDIEIMKKLGVSADAISHCKDEMTTHIDSIMSRAGYLFVLYTDSKSLCVSKINSIGPNDLPVLTSELTDDETTLKYPVCNIKFRCNDCKDYNEYLFSQLSYTKKVCF